MTQHSCGGPLSSKSGRFGVLTSQMYDALDMPSGCCWKPRMLYATAHFPRCPTIRVPADVARAPLDLARVAEHREGLGVRLLRALVVRLRPGEVLLVDVDGVVLLDEVLHLRAERGDGRDVRLVLLHLLAVADHVLGLRRIDVLGPPALGVREPAVGVVICCVFAWWSVRGEVHFGSERRGSLGAEATGSSRRVLILISKKTMFAHAPSREIPRRRKSFGGIAIGIAGSPSRVAPRVRRGRARLARS